jgi:dTDP-glucose 4,6-dehydratase
VRVLVTGGAGFIGSAVVRLLLGQSGIKVAVYDSMTYAASPSTLAHFDGRPDFVHFKSDICHPKSVTLALEAFEPDLVMHLAAESHVDRSIDMPAAFVQTNVVGTQVMLDACLAYWRTLDPARAQRFRFHHISTDEVFGSLGKESYFNESTAYDPRSPYSASKAASDHLARAWHHTFGLPVLITNCSNNYGPYQFPEKLIPLMTLRALARKPMPVYGDGKNIRDWLFVDDHAHALWLVARQGRVGETYAIGGDSERTNIAVATMIAELVDEIALGGASRKELITFVADRPGHDRRYAIDASKMKSELGWQPSCTFEGGLRTTVRWYLDNRSWWEPILDQTYRLERLGAVTA